MSVLPLSVTIGQLSETANFGDEFAYEVTSSMLFSLPTAATTVLKPFGFGLASTIRVNTERHEAGNEASHYLFWKTALERSENNPGAIMESAVERVSSTEFGDELERRLRSAFDRVNSARAAEPCGDGRANFGMPSCVFQGHVNGADPFTFVFAACPRPQ